MYTNLWTNNMDTKGESTHTHTHTYMWMITLLGLKDSPSGLPFLRGVGTSGVRFIRRDSPSWVCFIRRDSPSGVRFIRRDSPSGCVLSGGTVPPFNLSIYIIQLLTVCAAPPGEYQNPVNKKKIKLVSRESLMHYMGDPYPATKNIETAQEMRDECALIGEGWQTLEIEHFYEWQYINHAAHSKPSFYNARYTQQFLFRL